MGAFRTIARYEFRQKENAVVLDELKAAGIPYISLPSYLNTEVKTEYIGVLNGFVFWRAWRYWVCVGDMPLENAQEIYRLYHDLSVRAEGHAGNIQPTGYSPEESEKARAVMATMQGDGTKTRDMIAELEKIHANELSPRFVRQYHIDTTEGLAALAEYIRENGVFACNGAEGSYTQDTCRVACTNV